MHRRNDVNNEGTRAHALPATLAHGRLHTLLMAYTQHSMMRSACWYSIIARLFSRMCSKRVHTSSATTASMPSSNVRTSTRRHSSRASLRRNTPAAADRDPCDTMRTRQHSSSHHNASNNARRTHRQQRTEQNTTRQNKTGQSGTAHGTERALSRRQLRGTTTTTTAAAPYQCGGGGRANLGTRDDPRVLL
jgi:hypothetical protein